LLRSGGDQKRRNAAPLKEDDLTKKKEEVPRGLLFLVTERRFYTYHEGKLYHWKVTTEDWTHGHPLPSRWDR
jgi:hypothetical protein